MKTNLLAVAFGLIVVGPFVVIFLHFFGWEDSTPRGKLRATAKEYGVVLKIDTVYDSIVVPVSALPKQKVAEWTEICTKQSRRDPKDMKMDFACVKFDRNGMEIIEIAVSCNAGDGVRSFPWQLNPAGTVTFVDTAIDEMKKRKRK